ncbi:MAG: T9SS type A sorting domain-containing protein [Cytophagaceae bacterium]|nr:T9SS type A sorting domain-containing protein [Cytophagaceae bacterium]
MKIYIFFLLTIIISNPVIAQPPVPANETNIPLMEQKAYAAKLKAVKSGAENTYDIYYHRCEWLIDPAVNYIKGSVATHFKPTISSFSKMQFDLDTAFTIDSIRYHNTLLTWSKLPEDILQVNLPSVLPVNISDSVIIYYQGIPDANLTSFVQSEHNGTPIIWTLSEPYGAKDWWPCKQDLNDKIDSMDIIVTTPQVNRVASNGILLSEIVSGTDKIYHWKTKYRMAAYLVGIAVTNYVYYSDYVPLTAGSIEVLNYVYPEDLASAQSQTPEIINIIQYYDSLTILYPFANEKYGHAQFGRTGGMEHQTMSFVSYFSRTLLAHECAHQWFGDHVTCGSWEDIWLNEGFATYFEGLYEERFYPANWYAWKQNKINNITSQPGGSVKCNDTTSVPRIFSSRLSYNKGAYLLHMLRWKLGDSVFFLSLKNYLNTPGIASNYARTTDLQAALETTSGQSLTDFFNQWYYNEGYPSYQVIWEQNGNTLNVIINQAQSHPSVTFFKMPVPVKFVGATKDTLLVFDHTFSGENFTATIDFPIMSAQFDPELRILSKNNSVMEFTQPDILKDEVMIYPNPFSGDLSILYSLKNSNEFTVEIIDATGRAVLSQVQKLNSGNTPTALPTAFLSSGFYVLKITGKDFKHVQKIIKK